ncbi:helix-turn-helix domain-containing protein [Zavarzinia sp. CC-PAN008]|uniref:helix-turn-helix domain-containing protein n=1 Tax=Zavarzinia sp. CC-PAN008 TaxID=3243332 RepID=UPI003F74214A
MTLGTELRSERILQGRTLDQAAAHLRIRKDLLDAIEEGAYGRLPGAPYAIGFVRSYAEYLGFDGASAVARFKAEAELPDPRLNFPEPVAEAKAPTGRILAASLAVLVGVYLGFSYINRSDVAVVERIPPIPTELAPLPPPASVAVAATDAAAPGAGTAAPGAAPSGPVADGAAGAPGGPGGEPQPSWRDAAAATSEAATPPVGVQAGGPPASGDQMASVEPAPGTVLGGSGLGASGLDASALSAASGPAALAVELAAGDSRIVLHAERDSWIKIQDRDNQVLATKVLRAGDSLVVPNRPGARLTTGNAGGLEILVDGRPIQRLGAEGAVVRNISLDPQHLTNRSPD